VYAYFIFRKCILLLEKPRKVISTPKIVKPFPKLFQNYKLRVRLVFAFFWLLIVVHLELVAIGPAFIFNYLLVGAAGAWELSSEISYTNDYAADDYSHVGVHGRLILNTYLGIAM
jgi:hypothetical protein